MKTANREFVSFTCLTFHSFIESCSSHSRHHTSRSRSSDHSSAGATPKKLDEDAIFKSLKGFYRTVNGNYHVRIYHNGKQHNILSCKLQSDAALAYDEAARVLKGPKWSIINFAHKQAHRTLRAIELKKTGLNVDFDETLAKMSLKVKDSLSKIGKATDLVVGRLDQKESV